VTDHPSQITDAMVDDLVDEARTRNYEYAENDAVNELVIVMNSFDTNFDGGNEVYAANTRAFAYGVGETDGNGNWTAGETKRPIRIDKNERQRVYLVNATEFDPCQLFPYPLAVLRLLRPRDDVAADAPDCRHGHADAGRPSEVSSNSTTPIMSRGCTCSMLISRSSPNSAG